MFAASYKWNASNFSGFADISCAHARSSGMILGDLQPSHLVHSSLVCLSSGSAFFLKVVVTQLQELRACCISVILKQGSTVVESPGNLSSGPGLTSSGSNDSGQVILPL